MNQETMNPRNQNKIVCDCSEEPTWPIEAIGHIDTNCDGVPAIVVDEIVSRFDDYGCNDCK